MAACVVEIASVAKNTPYTRVGGQIWCKLDSKHHWLLAFGEPVGWVPIGSPEPFDPREKVALPGDTSGGEEEPPG